MVTKRLSVDTKRVNFFDGQRITRDELRDEQAHNVDIDAANVGNFLGSGVVRSDPDPRVIFDTENLTARQSNIFDGYSFDGQNLYIGPGLAEVSDTIQGVHLTVEMSGVSLSGAETSRISIFGISFGNLLIHDDLEFRENGKQITRGRYKEIRGILFSDFAGNLRGSRSPAVNDAYDFIGRCIIREATSLEPSFDHIVASQTQQPNKFFEPFIPASFGQTHTEMLQDSIGSDRSLSELDIGLSSLTTRELSANDVTTRYGQKFQAAGTNIQKMSVLLAVKEDKSVLPIDAYNWTGSITLSLQALQTDVDCPVDPTPDNAVDFDPYPSIIAQLALDKTQMEKQGVVLDGYSKIVEFVFTGDNVSDPARTPLVKDRFYVLAIGRSGDTSVGDIIIEEAPHRAEQGYMVVFDGIQWINVRENDLWFSIEGDYAKVSNGIAYEDGVGIEVPKISKDSTNTEVPFVQGLLEFTTTTRDAYNYSLLQPQSTFTDPEQDQRTGNQIFTRVHPAPAFSMITQAQLETLKVSKPAPVLIARIKDRNARGNPAEITGSSVLAGSVESRVFHVINPNADLLSHSLVGSLLIPDTSANFKYRIIEANLFSDSYGDVNGDGAINTLDVALVNSWVNDGYTFDLSTTLGQQEIMDGYATLDQVLRADVNGDGKIDASDAGLIADFVTRTINSFPAVGSSFSRLELVVENLLNPLDASSNMPVDNSTFSTAPFVSTPWKIEFCRTWMPDLISIEDLRRYMPTTFTAESTDQLPGGRNDFYAPGNLLIGGQQLNPDGTSYSVDFEVTHFTLDVPVVDSYGGPTFLDGYQGILLFDNFVSESSNGKTASNFTALKYHDGTYVQNGDFSAGRVKIVPTIQSTANKYTVNVGVDIDDIVGLYYDPGTSLMTLYMNQLFDDGYENALTPRNAKVSVVVYLKKAGFANDTQSISEGDMRRLFEI